MGNVDFVPSPTPMKVALWNIKGNTEPYQNVSVNNVGTLFHKLNISYLQEVTVLIFFFEESLNIHYQIQPFFTCTHHEGKGAIAAFGSPPLYTLL